MDTFKESVIIFVYFGCKYAEIVLFFKLKVSPPIYKVNVEDTMKMYCLLVKIRKQ
jgi:hypothetical protein